MNPTQNAEHEARLEAIRVAAERILNPYRGHASWLDTAEFDDLRAALDACRTPQFVSDESPGWVWAENRRMAYETLGPQRTPWRTLIQASRQIDGSEAR